MSRTRVWVEAGGPPSLPALLLDCPGPSPAHTDCVGCLQECTRTGTHGMGSVARLGLATSLGSWASYSVRLKFPLCKMRMLLTASQCCIEDYLRKYTQSL